MINLNTANSQIFQLNTELNKLQEQISSGNRISKGSEDIKVYDQIQKLDLNISKLTQINTNVDYALLYEETTETSMVEIETNIDQMLKELSTLATDGLNSENIQNSVLNQVELFIEDIYNISQTQLNGQYIYSGILSDVEPMKKVTIDGKTEYTYQASIIKKDTNVDDSNRHEYGLTGYEMFEETNIFNEYIHIQRLLTEPEIVMEEENQIELQKGIDRENEVLRQTIIDNIADPIQETAYLAVYDKYISALTEWNESGLETDKLKAENYLNILKGNSPTNLQAAAGTTLTNDFNVSSSFVSSTDGTYIATLSGVENLELRLDDIGANDNIHIFKKDGTHLVGPDLTQTVIDNNSAFFDINAIYKADPDKISGVSTTTSPNEYSATIDGNLIEYSGTTNPGVGYNSYGSVGTSQADEVVKINGMIGEDLVLIVEGGGGFNISTEWEDYSGITSIGIDDELDRLFNISDMKYTATQYLQADLDVEWIDPDTNLPSGISEKEHLMDVMEVQYEEFIKIEDDLEEIEAYNIFNYTKNPFSHQMEDVMEVQYKVNALRANIGSNVNYFTNVSQRNEQIILSNTLFRQDLVQIKPEEALLELQQRQISLQALYQAVSSIQKMSLVNYI